MLKLPISHLTLLRDIRKIKELLNASSKEMHTASLLAEQLLHPEDSNSYKYTLSNRDAIAMKYMEVLKNINRIVVLLETYGEINE